MANLNISFEIYNEEAVKNLQKNNPDILPTYSVNSQKDISYNKKQVSSVITSAIIQGKSIPDIASSLQSTIKNLNQSSAEKAARTAITSAQNAGTLSTMQELSDKGVEVQKEWVATLDDRTRDSHAALDGERVGLDEEFSNGLQYPGDPAGDPSEVWNCRCTIVSYIPKYDSETNDATRWSKDLETGERQYVSDMSYSEWIAAKQGISVESTISSTINYRNTARGKATAIAHYNVELNTRQQKLLDSLPEYDSKITVKKSDVSMTDLAALTAKTGAEYAMFTKGGERLILRGDEYKVNVTPTMAKKLSAAGYKWSGHTHPGTNSNVMLASSGDYDVLKAFEQKRSVIYNSMGEYLTFEV